MADVAQSKAPVAKVAAATAGAAVATVICLIIDAFNGDAGIPTGLEGALATVLAFGAGYITPPRSAQTPTPDGESE